MSHTSLKKKSPEPTWQVISHRRAPDGPTTTQMECPWVQLTLFTNNKDDEDLSEKVKRKKLCITSPKLIKKKKKNKNKHHMPHGRTSEAIKSQCHGKLKGELA